MTSRITMPALASSITDRAMSPTTSALRKRLPETSPDLVRVLPVRASPGWTFDARSAGTRPKRIAVRSEAARVNSRVRWSKWICCPSCSTKKLKLKPARSRDRKSTRLNSSHGYISYAVFCLKKKKNDHDLHTTHYTTEHIAASQNIH